MALVELRNISKSYERGETLLQALDTVNLEFEAGHFVAVMGASGSGKSTLLNLLGLLDRPTTGDYFLDGENVAHLDDDTMSEIRCRKTGIVFQSFNLFPHFSILQNVCVPMRYARARRSKMLDRAYELLDTVGLGDRVDDKPTRLSGGQCQRVAIARALANDPPLLLADEPTGNLDEHTGWEMMDLFRNLVENGRTVIMVTHNPEYESVVERVVRLHDGQIAEDTTNGGDRVANPRHPSAPVGRVSSPGPSTPPEDA